MSNIVYNLLCDSYCENLMYCFLVFFIFGTMFQPLSWRNIGALFKTKQKKEKTLCFPDPKGLTDYSELCNLTEANGGMAWFCGKPDTLLCKDLYSIELYQNKTEPVGRDIESILLSRYVVNCNNE